MEIPWQKLFYQNNADIYVWKRTTFQEVHGSYLRRNPKQIYYTAHGRHLKIIQMIVRLFFTIASSYSFVAFSLNPSESSPFES